MVSNPRPRPELIKVLEKKFTFMVIYLLPPEPENFNIILGIFIIIYFSTFTSTRFGCLWFDSSTTTKLILLLLHSAGRLFFIWPILLMTAKKTTAFVLWPFWQWQKLLQIGVMWQHMSQSIFVSKGNKSQKYTVQHCGVSEASVSSLCCINAESRYSLGHA